jgi:hypothetical protein
VVGGGCGVGVESEFVSVVCELLLLPEVSASDPVPPWLLLSQPAINAAAANKMNSFFILNITPYR